MKLHAVLLCFLFLSFGVNRANSAVIQGYVVDSELPLPGVNVWIDALKTGTSTNEKGFFSLSNVPEGKFQLRFSMTGYETLTEEIQVAEQDTISLSIRLLPLSNSLQEVVISGTLSEQSKSQSPVPIDIYTPEFFKKNPTPALFESLQIVNGVRPQINCSVCNTGDIHINGMEGPYTLVMIDGMPIVSGLGTVYGLNGIPNALVERMEIIKGPSSTLYGSEAIGGVINVITKSPTNAPLFSLDIMGNPWMEWNTDLGLKYRLKKNTGLLGINYFRYDLPKDNNGDGFTDLTLQDRISVFHKIDFARKSGLSGSIAMRYVYEDRWGGQMNWTPEFRGGDSIYGESIYTNRYEILGYWEYLFAGEKMQFRTSFSDHFQNSVYGTTSFIARQKIAFVQNIWSKTIGANQLTGGLSLRMQDYDDNTVATSDTSGNNRADQSYIPGLFLQNEWNRNNKHVLLSGIRLDYHSKHGLIPSPRLNWKWSPNTLNTLRAGIGNGFRVVNIFTEDHAALTGSRTVVIEEGILPEKSWNGTVNYAHTVTGKKSFMLFEITAFYTHFSNKILADYTTNDAEIRFANLNGYAVSRGAGFSWEWNYDGRLKMSLGTTFLDVFRVENQIRSEQVLTERWSGTFSVSWKISPKSWTVDYTGNVYGKMKLPLLEADFRAPESPVYSIQNIQFTYRKGKWDLYFGVKNLLNFTPPANSIMRPFDPFDKTAGDPVSNPNGYTFDTTYVYSSFQGIRAFWGLRYVLGT